MILKIIYDFSHFSQIATSLEDVGSRLEKIEKSCRSSQPSVSFRRQSSLRNALSRTKSNAGLSAGLPRNSLAAASPAMSVEEQVLEIKIG